MSHQIPPHNLQAEESLLGAMLLSREAIAAASERLRPEDFYKPAHQHVFAAVIALATAGQPADPVTVADGLRRDGLLDTIGGPAILLNLQAGCPATSNARRYADIIRRDSIARRRIGLAGEITEAAWEDAPERLAEKSRALALLSEARYGAADHLLAGIRSGAWLDAQTFPDIGWHVEGLVPEGYSLLVGPPKLGKSWFVLGLGLAIAAGGVALGRLTVEQRPVLYLALEDGDRRLQDRSRRLLGPQGRIPAGFEYVTRLRPDDAMPLVEAWLGRNVDRAPLVMVDTLGKVMPSAMNGETTYQRDYRIGSTLKRLVDDVPGSAILVNHHDRKAGSEDFVEAVSGTNGLAGAADSVLVLSRKRLEEAGTLKVTGRDVEEAEYALTFRRDEAWKLDGRTLAEAASNARERQATEGVSDRSAEIIAMVNRHPEGIKAVALVDALGIDRKTVDTYLGRLYKSGRIGKAGWGLYGPVGSVGSVGNDEGDQATGADDSQHMGEGVGNGAPPPSRDDAGFPTLQHFQHPLEPLVVETFPGAEPVPMNGSHP
jgi:hypothetical protein